jgi:hypothetical protein
VTSLLLCLATFSAELPAGHILEARLTSKVASDLSRPGDIVTAEVISPCVADGRVLVPPGSILLGRVTKAAALGFGIKRGRAHLRLDFDEILFPTGEQLPVRMALAKVDTAREETTASGDVSGISPAVSVSSALAAYAWRLVILEPALGAAVWAIKFAMAPAPDPEIRLPVGTEILVRVLDGVEMPETGEGAAIAPVDRDEAEQWRRRLEATPLRVARKSGAEADRINLFLAGSADSIQRAFQAAGWHPGDARTPSSLVRTYYHIVQRKGYPTGPMSTMRFEGRDPDYTFQKTLNTYARRHHLRVWRAGESDTGVALWVAAATEDTSIHFSRKAKNWTHEIDFNIDNERAKVASDLLYTGCVEAVSLIEMKPIDSPEFLTDGAVAGLRFNDCASPKTMASTAKELSDHAFSRGVKNFWKELVRSNLSQIAVTGAHVPPQAFAAKPAAQNHREAWAQQQATLWNRRAIAE